VDRGTQRSRRGCGYGGHGVKGVDEEVIVRQARPDEAEAIHQVLVAAFRGLRDRRYSHRALEVATGSPEEISCGSRPPATTHHAH